MKQGHSKTATSLAYSSLLLVVRSLQVRASVGSRNLARQRKKLRYAFDWHNRKHFAHTHMPPSVYLRCGIESADLNAPASEECQMNVTMMCLIRLLSLLYSQNLLHELFSAVKRLARFCSLRFPSIDPELSTQLWERLPLALPVRLGQQVDIIVPPACSGRKPLPAHKWMQLQRQR